ncbi:Hypothetical protein NTJ_02363 [Nesidiocoris tenuis]|uniref:Uncharacterized protein n=1 Tax=Nesidiocoris tenuis TaxID=355587 RepID=A0ABN7AB58_9HEMI|nr:Hypothetical protein NTJ_02363 [Nesidiocoris tenuis]
MYRSAGSRTQNTARPEQEWRRLPIGTAPKYILTEEQNSPAPEDIHDSQFYSLRCRRDFDSVLVVTAVSSMRGFTQPSLHYRFPSVFVLVLSIASTGIRIVLIVEL